MDVSEVCGSALSGKNGVNISGSKSLWMIFQRHVWFLFWALPSDEQMEQLVGGRAPSTCFAQCKMAPFLFECFKK